ncbi:hypothetical protein NL676_036685 [Syzygium grande]|nr:hypothetical protein NL676_036685 [Syzygium grande]
MLDRMMRLLASHGVIEWRARRGDGDGDGGGDGREIEYGAGPMCSFLAKDEEGALSVLCFCCIVTRSSWRVVPAVSSTVNLEKTLDARKDYDISEEPIEMCLALSEKIVFMFDLPWIVLYHLNDVIMDGGVPFERAYGMMAFEYPAIDDRYLTSHGGFQGVKVLVDVGGGIGVTLKMITSKHPHIKASISTCLMSWRMLLLIQANQIQDLSVEHVGGDMFESVPRGDAIFMKWILHDWSDEHCSKVLKNCYEALPANGKVIIIESILPVVPDRNVSSNIVFEQDLLMFAQNPGGKERTQKEFEALAVQAGFAGCEVKCCAYNSWVMEFPKTVGH